MTALALSNPDLVSVAMEEVFYDTMASLPDITGEILNYRTTDSGTTQFSNFWGAAPTGLRTGEVEQLTFDEIGQGYDKTFTDAEYARGVSMSRKLFEDDRTGALMDSMGMLARAAVSKRNTLAANVYNNAFSTTGPDGKVLCASDHPADTGTQSNLLTGDLGYASLRSGVAAERKRQDHRGNRLMSVPRKVIVPAEEEFAAVELTNSLLRPTLQSGDQVNSANTLTNMNAAQRLGLDVVVVPDLSDTDAWFLQSDTHQAYFVDRLAPYQEELPQDSTLAKKYYCRFRSVAGFVDWRGVSGSAGA